MSRRSAIGTLIVAALLLALPGSAGASHVTCFQTVTQDTTFDGDVTCPAIGAGLVIGAPGITVDLNGYTLKGLGNSGVLNAAGHDDVRIRNGMITGFWRGVQLMNGATGNEVEDLTTEVVPRNAFDIPDGVYLENSDDNLIRGITQDTRNAVETVGSSRTVIDSSACGTAKIVVDGGTDTRIAGSEGCDISIATAEGTRVEDNDHASISVFQSSSLVIVGNRDSSARLERVQDSLIESNDGLPLNLFLSTGNTINGNSASPPRLPPTVCSAPDSACGAILLQQSTGNSVQGNDLSGGDVGIGLLGSPDNVVAGNTISSAAHSGIRIYSSDRNQVSGNTVTDIDGIGIDLQASSDDNLVEENSVAAAGVDGILAENVNVTGNVIAGNTVSGSGDDGIDVRRPATAVTANSAFENGDWGIEAAAGTIDGGSNRAWSNGQPAQCLNIVCGPGPPASLALTPESATNTVGDEHCVTATVADPDGRATPGETVRFSVNGDGTATAETDAGGTATFCYDGPLSPGTDEIAAFADTDGDATQDPGEPSDTATKTWVVPAAERCKVTGAGTLTAANGDDAHFSLSAHVTPARLHGRHTYRDFGPSERFLARSRTIESVTCSEATASVYGTVVVSGTAGSLRFRIDVADSPDTYRIRLSNGYDSGGQPVAGGNIRVQ